MEIQGFTTKLTEEKSLVPQPMPEFDLEKQNNEVMTKVKDGPEVRSIVRQINIEDVGSIMSFGKAMSALDEKTNELLLRNAQNTALQPKMVAKLASGSSVSIETLEQSWQTIVPHKSLEVRRCRGKDQSFTNYSVTFLPASGLRYRFG